MTTFSAINMPEQTTFQLKDFTLDPVSPGTEEANNEEMNPDEAIELDEIPDVDTLVVSDDGSDEDEAADAPEICPDTISSDEPMLFMASAGPKVEKKGKVKDEWKKMKRIFLSIANHSSK